MRYPRMISIVMPYWNRQEATVKALALLEKQYAGMDIEIVVVDDGSPEPFMAPPSKLSIRVVRLPTKSVPKNPSIPFIEGVKAALGDVIVLTNPEILHEAPVLPSMLEELEALGPDGYVMAAAWCPEHEEWHCHTSRTLYVPGVEQPKGSGLHFCAMLNRSLWDKAGGFDTAYRDGAGFEDNDWVMRLGEVGARFKIRDDLVVIHPKSGATTEWPEGGFERNEALFRLRWERVTA